MCRGFGFVRFTDRRDAEEAMQGMEGAMIDGREIHVMEARHGRRPAPSRDGGYGRYERGGGGYDRDRRGGYDRDRRGGYDRDRGDYGRDRRGGYERERGGYERGRDRDYDRKRYDRDMDRRAPDRRDRSRSRDRRDTRYRDRSRSRDRRRGRTEDASPRNDGGKWRERESGIERKGDAAAAPPKPDKYSESNVAVNDSERATRDEPARGRRDDQGDENGRRERED